MTRYEFAEKGLEEIGTTQFVIASNRWEAWRKLAEKIGYLKPSKARLSYTLLVVN
jgi:hypothetical protein